MFGTINRYLRYYFTLKGKNLQGRMVNRLDFFLYIFCDFIIQLTGVVFFYALFSNIPSFNGWKIEDVVLVYGLFQLCYGLFGFVFWPLYDFGYLLASGGFDSYLMRPMSALFQLLSKGMGDVGGILLGLGLVLYSAGKGAFVLSPLNILLFAIFLACGIALYTCIYTLIASASFWMEQSSDGLFRLLNMATDYAKFPFNIYSKGIRVFLTWFIPVGFIGFYPASYFLSNEWGAYMLYLPLVIGGFVLATALVWRRGLRRYRGTGS